MPMSEIRIAQVSGKKDLETFIRLPWKIYKDFPNWVPPLLLERRKILDRKRNPFYNHSQIELFIAYRGNEPVGRIAAIKNDMHLKYHNDSCGFFGFFECINDMEAAGKLFDSAKEWIKSKGLTAVMGPANPSSNDDWGLLIEGYEYPPAFMMPYNPPYYSRLIEGYGFRKEKDLNGYKISDENVTGSDKITRMIRAIKERYKIEIKKVNMKDYAGELNKVKYVYNSAWAPNWGFIPLTDEEINSVANDLKPLIEPNLLLFVESEGKTIGFTLTLPDYNQVFRKMNGRIYPFGIFKFFTGRRKITLARILTLGIIPEFQKKGIDALLYWELVNNAAELGIRSGEASWILEDNEMMNKVILNIGGRLYKKYRIYKLNI